MKKMIEYYQELYKLHGNSPHSLGWHKGKQFLRFHQLTSEFNMNNASILDVGCGFGDFIKYLEANEVRGFSYTGIDIMEEFINQARISNPIGNYIHADFLEHNFNTCFDYLIASGTFNFKIEGIDGYDYIYESMKKMFTLSKKALSIDFLTDRVDYFHEHNFNSNPMKILEMAYSLSKRVILNNSIFPFEFAITIYKDDTFEKDKMFFNNI